MKNAEKPTTVLSTKGQVILPKSIREKRGWSTGTRLVVEEAGDGVVLRPAPVFPAKTPAEVFRMLNYKGPAKSIADMDEAVRKEAQRRHARD